FELVLTLPLRVPVENFLVSIGSINLEPVIPLEILLIPPIMRFKPATALLATALPIEDALSAIHFLAPSIYPPILSTHFLAPLYIDSNLPTVWFLIELDIVRILFFIFSQVETTLFLILVTVFLRKFHILFQIFLIVFHTELKIEVVLFLMASQDERILFQIHVVVFFILFQIEFQVLNRKFLI